LEDIMTTLASAVFDNHSQADRAVADLRAAGIDDSAISIVAQHEGTNTTTDGSGAQTATDVVGKTAAGAGIGTLLGIAALAIPGVGPFVAAGAIAAAAVPTAAITGAAIGAAAGGLASVFADYGVSREDADYYEKHVGQGGVFVSVDGRNSSIGAADVDAILSRNGGHSSTRARMTAAM
jgi:uncharacterized membrane protein